MKLLIAADMEGITGVVDWKHVDSTHPEYQRFRQVMTADVNAAVAGAAEAGASEIWVADGHGYARNILIESLDPRARLNSGSPSPFAMIQGIDRGIQAVMFVGYHAHMSTQAAVLAHTWSSERVSNVWLNGRVAGEIGLNASVCGSFGASVILITGDQAACNEAAEWIPGIETAVVKTASGRNSAECLPPAVSQPLIHQAAGRAVERFLEGAGPGPLQVDLPARITIEFLSTVMADNASLMPGVNRLDGRRVELEAGSTPDAYRFFRVVVALAGTVY